MILFIMIKSPLAVGMMKRSKQILGLGKKNIIVCGIEAHICVLQTVIDLLQEGIHVVVVEDCIGSRKDNDKKIALERRFPRVPLLLLMNRFCLN